MKAYVSFPLFALFGLTRGMGGVGAGLLLADRIPHKRRKKLGLALFAVGVASTLPLIVAFVQRSRRRTRTAGVMNPMTEVYQPEMGTVDDADIESPELAPETLPLRH